MFSKSQNLAFQKIIATAIILGACLILYSVTKKFDYDWSWEKIPSYFVSDNVEVQEVPSDGIFKKAGPMYYIETDAGQKVMVDILNGYELDVEPEMYVYQGDDMAVRKTPTTGIFLTGLWLTIKISLFAAVLAFILGLFAGLARLSSNPILSWPTYIYIELIRGTPLLVQLFIIYFMFGTVFGVDDRFACGVIALGLFGGAYSAEVIRSGIQSIDKGQMEAARSLGMNYFQAMLYVVFPQMLRRSIAALAGIFISLIKDSSLVSVMALTDLTKAGREVVSTSFMVFEVWIVVALLYFAMTYGTSYLTSLVEKRLAIGEAI
jgi:polar amino acid transport system permease protein